MSSCDDEYVKSGCRGGSMFSNLSRKLPGLYGEPAGRLTTSGNSVAGTGFSS